ncbi:unnamed protein product [Caretta caretta]
MEPQAEVLQLGVGTLGANELRLADGGSPCAGRVEVKHQDRWGTVCSRDWDMEDAAVVCANELRLADGGSPCAGRVEVKHQDRWGTVCSRDWDMEDAAVVCSRRPLDPFPEAVYEEIDYNLMREKQEMFSRSDDSVTKLQYYTGDSEGENDPGSEQEEASPGGSELDYDNVEEPALNDVPQTPDGRDAPALPGDVPGDGYDDTREVSDSEGDPGLGQNDKQGIGASDRERDSQTGGSLQSLGGEVVSGMEKETPSLLLGDTGYDDVGHGDSGGSIS